MKPETILDLVFNAIGIVVVFTFCYGTYFCCTHFLKCDTIAHKVAGGFITLLCAAWTVTVFCLMFGKLFF